MSIQINKTTVIGNLTKSIEIKALPSGIKVASINLATNRTWKDANGEKKEQVTYFEIKAFGKQAEVLAQYVHVGDQLYIEARMVNANYEKDGQKVYRNDFILEQFQFGQKSSKNASETPQNAHKSNLNEEMSLDTFASNLTQDGDISLDDIPF